MVQHLLDTLYGGYAVAIGYILAADGRTVMTPRQGRRMRWELDDRVVAIIRHAPKVSAHFGAHPKRAKHFWDSALRSSKHLKGGTTLDSVAASIEHMEHKAAEDMAALRAEVSSDIAALCAKIDKLAVTFGTGGAVPLSSAAVVKPSPEVQL